MRKFTKIVLIVVVIAIALYFAAVASLNTFLNPNNFKTKITALVQQKTGRTLSMADGAHWALFPQIAIKLNDVKLSNTANFGNGTFIAAQEVRLNVRLLPLLTGKIDIASININGLTLHLIKNMQGKTNWATTTDTTPTKKTKSKHNSSTPAITASHDKNPDMVIANLNVTNGTVIWDDQQSKQSFTINNFNAHGKNINFTQAFPLQLSFTLINNAQANTPINLSLDTQLLANLEKNTYGLSDLTITSGQTHLKGNLSYKLAKISQLNFDLAIDQLNLDTYSDLFTNNPKTTSPSKKHTENSKSDAKAEQQSPYAALNNLDIKGNVKIDNLVVKKVALQNFNLTINNSDNVLKLSPITANLYQGSINSNVTVNNQETIPVYTLDGNLNNVQIGSLLQDLTGKTNFSGATTVDAKITTQGKQKSTLIRSLNGNINLSVANGAIHGMDIFGLIRGNINLSNTTQFSSLTGTAVITDGILQNHDLALKAENISAHGAGAVNFIKDQVFYRIIANGKVNEKSSVEIPVSIHGSLDNLQASIDAGSLAKKAAVQQLGKQIEKQIGAPVQDLLKKVNLNI